MPTLWIIDGYNFIRQSSRFSEIEAENGAKGRKLALAWLARFGDETGERVRVVFDAYSSLRSDLKVEPFSGIEVYLSRGSYTADEEIIQMAQEKGESAVVVSSDRMIQDAAVKAGASILKSDEFEREVGKILDGPNDWDEDLGSKGRKPGKGNAFRPPKEKKKAFALLKKYQG